VWLVTLMAILPSPVPSVSTLTSPARIASSKLTAGSGAGAEVFEAGLSDLAGLVGSSARAALPEMRRPRVASQSRERSVDFMTIAFPFDKFKNLLSIGHSLNSGRERSTPARTAVSAAFEWLG